MAGTVAHGSGVSPVSAPVRRRRSVSVGALAAFAALALTLAALVPTVTGCNSVCTSACDKQYNDCVRKAPSGTSHYDCGEQQQQCVARCTTGRTADHPEGEPN